MNAKKLTDLIDELLAEVSADPTLEQKDLLLTTIEDLQSLRDGMKQDNAAGQDDDYGFDLDDLVLDLEVSHPVAAGVMGRIVQFLNSLGI